MEYDPEIMPIFKKATEGCPESEFIMAHAFMDGNGVPKDEKMAYLFFMLLATDHNPEELEDILDTDYGTLLALVGMLAFRQEEYENAMKYSKNALNYIWNNYPKEEAIPIIEYLKLGERLDYTEAILSNRKN